MNNNIVVIGSTLTDVVSSLNNAMPTVPANDRETLAELINQLKAELEKVPQVAPDKAKEAGLVERRTKELVDEAGVEEPDKEEVGRRGLKLKEAAENIGKAMPAVASLVPQILSLITKIVH